MLVLSRRPGQMVQILPHPALDPATPIGELFREGPIEIMVTHVSSIQVRLGFSAHASFLILRNELIVEGGKWRVF